MKRQVIIDRKRDQVDALWRLLDRETDRDKRKQLLSRIERHNKEWKKLLRSAA